MAVLRSFFDKVNHQWMEQFLAIERPSTGRGAGVALLKGGILEDGLVHATEEGTPKGRFSRRCCRTYTCTAMCWISCGLDTEYANNVEVRRSTFALPMTLWVL